MGSIYGNNVLATIRDGTSRSGHLQAAKNSIVHPDVRLEVVQKRSGFKLRRGHTVEFFHRLLRLSEQRSRPGTETSRLVFIFIRAVVWTNEINSLFNYFQTLFENVFHIRFDLVDSQSPGRLLSVRGENFPTHQLGLVVPVVF